MNGISTIGQYTPPAINTGSMPTSTSIGQGAQGETSLGCPSAGTKSLTCNLGDNATRQACATGSGITKSCGNTSSACGATSSRSSCGAANTSSSCAGKGIAKTSGDDEENTLLDLLKKILSLLTGSAAGLGTLSKATKSA